MKQEKRDFGRIYTEPVRRECTSRPFERMTAMQTRNAAKKKNRKILYVETRAWVFLLILFMAIFIPLYHMLNNRSNQVKEQVAELLAQKQALSERVLSLKSDLEYARSDAGIEQYARAEGMIMPGEIKYTTASGADN